MEITLKKDNKEKVFAVGDTIRCTESMPYHHDMAFMGIRCYKDGDEGIITAIKKSEYNKDEYIVKATFSNNKNKWEDTLDLDKLYSYFDNTKEIKRIEQLKAKAMKETKTPKKRSISVKVKGR